MAKASIVSAQQQRLLEDLNAKLDLLLENAGLKFEGKGTGEAPKPIKTFAKAPAPVPPVPQEPDAPVKTSPRKKNG